VKTTALLITDELGYQRRILNPVRWVGFVLPTLSTIEFKEQVLRSGGWGILIRGRSCKKQGCATRHQGAGLSNCESVGGDE